MNDLKMFHCVWESIQIREPEVACELRETNVQGMMYELACTDYARIFVLFSARLYRNEKSVRMRRFTYI